MYNYYADLAWQLNNILFALALLFGLFIILYSTIKEIFVDIYGRNLVLLKSRLESLALSKTEPQEKRGLFINTIDPLEITRILRNKELVLSKEARRELESCFASEGKTAEIENVAKHSKNKWRRIQAIITLGYSEYPTSVDILKKSLLDRDEDVSYFSMVALGQMKTIPAAKILLDFLPKHIYSGYKIASLLETFPASITEEVVKATEDPDPQVRFWAIKIASKFKPYQYLNRLTELAEDISDDVRAAACECLGEIGSFEAKGVLINCLKDKVWFVRMRAVRGLHKILKGECIPDVIVLIKDENWLVRDSIKRVLADSIETSLPFIEKIMRQDNELAKKACIDALEDSGYLVTLIDDILLGDADKKQRSFGLLENLIRSNAHLGLESAIKVLNEEKQRAILGIIAGIDKNLAEHIEKKIKGEIVEA